MRDWLRGRPAITNLVSTVGDGGNKTLQFAPSPGQRWIIVELQAWHDDNGGARDCIILLYGKDGTYQYVRSTVSLVAYARISVLATVTGTSVIGEAKGGPLILNHGDYIQLTVNTLGAGKYTHLDGLCVKQFGVPEWA